MSLQPLSKGVSSKKKAQKNNASMHDMKDTVLKNGSLTFGMKRSNWPESIVKRDGRIVAFDVEKIEKAIDKCFRGIDQASSTEVSELALRVANFISAKFDHPTVENVQDAVEVVLQAAGEFEAAKSYILYRAEHARLREERPVPESVKKAFDESDAYFPTQ